MTKPKVPDEPIHHPNTTEVVYEDVPLKALPDDVAAALYAAHNEAVKATDAAFVKVKALALTEGYAPELAAASYWAALHALLDYLHPRQ